MKGLGRIGLVALFIGIFSLPLVLAQINDRQIEIFIGKAKTAKEQIKIAYGLHFDKKDFPGAIAAYQDVITRFPESPEAAEAQFRIANIYHWDLVKPEKAITEYQKVIQAYPQTGYAIETLIRLGEVYIRLNQFDKSIEVLQRVINNHPNTPYVPWAMLVLGNVIYFDQFDPLRAKPTYQEILTKYPNTEYAAEAQLWLTRIGVEREGLAPQEAIRIYQGILTASPQYYHVQAAVQYTIGYTYLTSGQNQQALTEFQKVLDNYPNTHEDWLALTLYFIGHAYINLGQLAQAETKFNQGFLTYPNTIWREDLQKQLQIVRSLRAISP